MDSARTARRRLGWSGGIGIVVTLLLLWWVLHDVDFRDVRAHLAHARIVWLAAAVAAATLTFPLRTVRWRYLLRIEGATLPFRPLWHATAIGFMANNLLPARAGEFARAYAARELGGVRFSTAFASIAVERILDGITLVAFFVVAVAAAGFEAGTAVRGGVTVGQLAALSGALFGALLVAALAVVRWPQQALAVARWLLRAILPDRWAGRVMAVAEGMLEGLDALRAPRRLAAAVVWSAIVWAVGAASFWLAFRAFGIDAPWSAAVFLQSVIGFIVAVPSAPGFFGTYEGAARASLTLYGVSAGLAVSMAIGFHIGGFVPITVLGLYSLWSTGLHLGDLRGDAGREPTAGEADPGSVASGSSSGVT